MTLPSASSKKDVLQDNCLWAGCSKWPGQSSSRHYHASRHAYTRWSLTLHYVTSVTSQRTTLHHFTSKFNASIHQRTIQYTQYSIGFRLHIISYCTSPEREIIGSLKAGVGSLVRGIKIPAFFGRRSTLCIY